ncbi:MAG: S8 family serine peptidase [Phycisphaerae bacterium]|jgi:subtilisin family serine protease
MRKCVLGILAGLLCTAALPALAGTIDPALEAILDITPPGDTVSVLVYLEDRVDINLLNEMLEQDRASRQVRHEVVVRTLQEKAESTQGPLVDHLKRLTVAGQVESFRAYWITNLIRVDLPASEVAALAAHPSVGTIYFNYPIESIKDIDEGPVQGGARTPEVGLQAVRAPEVWALGFTGAGVLVSTLDTGVDGSHEALASRWRGVADPRYAGHPEWAFFDPVTGWTFPQDSASHGTHTMGTVCGGAPGDEVGVAPGAQWIHAAVVDRVSLLDTCEDAIEAYQWLIDPDGNPNTVWDVPHTNSNSWGIGSWHNVPPYNAPCDDSFWSYIDACEAAGTIVFFSAGNEGPSAESLRRPGDRAYNDYQITAVGGIDANNPPNWVVYNSSSRGPTHCTPTGAAAIKPEIAAPAVSVRSSIPGSYGQKTGTSMASPHINGVAALILEACPELSVQDVKQIMFDTALDLGPTGKDNDFGYGLVDAYEAVNLALAMCGDNPPRVYDGYYETPVGVPVTVELQATDYDGGPLPISFKVVSLPAAGNTLTDAGNGHVILAGELPYTLVNNGNELLYTPAGAYYGNDTLTFVANDGGTPPDGGDSDLGTVNVVVLYGPPTIATETLPEGCLGRAYGPVQLEADQGQPELVWTMVTDEYLELDMGSSQFAAVGVAQGWRADDSYWTYDLPFSFPYFGSTYNTVYVSSNGLIDFDGGDSEYDNSTAELIANKRIAPLWDDIRTNCNSGDDIFIDESVAGQVTIRWVGTVYKWDCSGNPLSFSCTLFNNGSIQFNYGAGNIGLTPTIGISAGDGVHYLLSSYDGAGSLTWANSHEFVQPVPLPDGVVLDADGTLHGVPAEFGTFEPRFAVTDSLGRSDVKAIPLVISEVCSYELGDMNCDGLVDNFDISPFVLALTSTPPDYAEYYAQYPGCDHTLADVNGDGSVDNFDISPFITILLEP